MASPLPSQPPPAAAPSPAAPQAPGLVQAFLGVLTRPAEFFESVRDVGGFGAPVVFALVMGLLSGIVSAVYAVVGLGAVGGVAGGALGAVAGFGAVITTPIFAVVGVFVGGAIVHVIGLVAGGKGSYEQSARIAAYAGAVMPIGALLGFHPLVRMLPGLYGLYLVAVGLIAIHAADRKRTYTVVGILAALLVLLSVMAMFAVRAARQLGSELQTQLGAGSDFQRDTQKLQEEMKRVADELQRRAQQQQPPAPPPPQAAPPAEAQPPAPPPAQPEPQK